MVAGLVLASVIGVAGQPVSLGHVRATEARILAIVEDGVARSATFRRLIETLDASDVIVYIGPKFHREALAGYLAHRLIVAGPLRYIKIALDMNGPGDRVVALMAHELQHAVEVAEAPEVRDSQSMVRMFERTSLDNACGGGNCDETKAAIEIQEAVFAELRTTKPAVMTALLRND
jgi:hypothetical protein